MSDIIRPQSPVTETIAKIQIDGDELLRLKQLTGLKELFKDRPFSSSWVV